MSFKEFLGKKVVVVRSYAGYEAHIGKIVGLPRIYGEQRVILEREELCPMILNENEITSVELYPDCDQIVSKEPDILFIDSEDGDWTEVVINGKRVYGNHSIDERHMLELLGIHYETATICGEEEYFAELSKYEIAY